jgi:cathepsin D
MGFSEMTSLTSQFTVAKMDGILGMGYPQISMNGLTPLMPLLKQQGKIDKNVVTFALAHTGEDSVMIVGGEDASLRSEEFVYHPVTQKGYWMIDVDSVKMGDKVVASNLKGIVDTGTSLMVASKDTLGDIANITVKQDCSSPTSDMPDITFTIGGKEYTLTGDDYVVKASALGQTACLNGFRPMALPPQLSNAMIMGDVFLRKFVTSFDMDNDQVGFALRK